MIMKTYDIIYVDPPWDYAGQKQHKGPGKTNSGGAKTHYDTVKLAKLKGLPLSDFASKDCLLFMWVTSPHLDQGIDLMKSWGFKYATVAFIWDKVKVNPGFYTMSQVEMCLIGKRGKIPGPRGSRNVRQFLSSERTKHSEKPAEIRYRIEKMFPTQSKLELFSRIQTPGWTAWGNQSECQDQELRDFLSQRGWIT